MIKLTDPAGNAIYFNTEHVGVVRNVIPSEATLSTERAQIFTYSGTFFVQETVADVIKKLG